MGTGSFHSLHHPFLGNVQFNQQLQLIKVIRPIPTLGDYKFWISRVPPAHQQPYLYLPQSFSLVENSCFSGELVELDYPAYLNSLQKEMDKRKGFQDFSQEELWYLLLVTVKTLSSLKSKNLCLGMLRPSTIFLNQSGEIKLFSQLSAPGQLSAFHQKMVNPDDQNYLAPEQLTEILKNNFRARVDHNLAEIYSLGLILITCMTFTAPATCMVNNELIYRQEVLIKQLKQSKAIRYSSQLFDTIRLLLKPKEERPCAASLMELLGPLQADILAMKKLVFQ